MNFSRENETLSVQYVAIPVIVRLFMEHDWIKCFIWQLFVGFGFKVPLFKIKN